MIVETRIGDTAPWHRGKVRDTYDLGDGLLLMVSTDRISAFDVVLPNGIPRKGLVLARMAAFWFRQTAGLVDNHLVGLADDEGVVKNLGGDSLLGRVDRKTARQAMVVRRAQRIRHRVHRPGIPGRLRLGGVQAQRHGLGGGDAARHRRGPGAAAADIHPYHQGGRRTRREHDPEPGGRHGG